MGNEFKGASYIGEISPEKANYLVADLNQQIFDKLGDDTVLVFEVNFNGIGTTINWCGLQLWSSDDDEREIIATEYGDDYSDLKQFIVEQMTFIKNRVAQIIFE